MFNHSVQTVIPIYQTNIIRSFDEQRAQDRIATYVGGCLEHVVTVPARDGHESDGLWVVADLLDEAADLLLDLSEASLREGGLSAVHLVDCNDELLDTEGEGEQSVLTGLAILGDTSLELTGTGGNDKHSTISL